MLVEDTRTCWPALHLHGVPANYLVEARAGCVPSERASQSLPAIDADAAAPPVQTGLQHRTIPTFREDVPADKHSSQEASPAESDGNEKHTDFVSVVDILAVALSASATGAIQDVNIPAPPPRAR